MGKLIWQITLKATRRQRRLIRPPSSRGARGLLRFAGWVLVSFVGYNGGRFTFHLERSVGDPSVMRFRLRTALVAFSLCAVGGAYLHYSLDYPAVQAITTREEWDKAIASRKCVVFVMGDWNFESGVMERELEPFSSWAKWRGVRVLTLTIDAFDQNNDVWKISAEINEQNQLYPGSMKNLNGAGRVLWFKHGKLAGHAWGPGGPLSQSEHEVSYLEFLKERTEKAFW